ncbi:MAG TPA: hypothetical protein VFO26_05490 [Gaiella sp.]|uniref:hypothetical protein n=1 Tax=Gaiella sp. TaxID=2663207 RepID=UPI002D8035AB|nr:hypothetical protein [Gaiella sp.]HET9286992.1 hypothetical protein [Gaiella sp.]
MGQPSSAYSPEQLRELLDAWRRPAGVLGPDQLRALIAWSGTPDADREALETSLSTTQQHVEAKPLAPRQRRGHVSRLDRLRGFFDS